MPKPKVMFLINSLAGGGAERVMSTLLSHSEAEAGAFDISLALLDREPVAYEPPRWLRVRQLDCRGSLRASLDQVGRLCADERPDLVLSFLTRANLANVAAARGGRHVAVVSERVNTTTHLGGGLRGGLGKLMVRAAYPRAAKVVAVSPGVAEDLRSNFAVPAGKIVTIENPFDLEMIRARAAEPPSPAIEPPYTVGVGRLVANKNFAMLIEAFRLSGVPGRLVILGDGPERGALTALIRERGLEGRVLLPGFADNPFAIVGRAAVFVLSSNAEGFPNSLVEAMALGVPAIATNCSSGPSEILAGLDRGSVQGVVRGEYGILTPPRSAEHLAEALRTMQDDRVRRGYSAQAALRAEDFRVERAKARYWAVIGEALADRRPGGGA